MAKKDKSDGPNLPEGFEPLSRATLDGWYVVQEGNAVQGFYRGSFQVPDSFRKGKTKTVHRIELTETKDGTECIDSNGDTVTLNEGSTIGVDEKGWLKALEGVEEGREVFIRCKGKGEAKKGMSPPWLFDLGVVPI